MRKPKRLPIVDELGATADWPTAEDREKLEGALAVVLDAYNRLDDGLRPTLLTSLISTVCMNTSHPQAMLEALRLSFETAIEDILASRHQA